MSDTNHAEQLRAAAFQLRNPFHPPGLKIAIDPSLGELLADWLAFAASAAARLHGLFADSDDPCEFIGPHALAVARAVLGEEAQQ